MACVIDGCRESVYVYINRSKRGREVPTTTRFCRPHFSRVKAGRAPLIRTESWITGLGYRRVILPDGRRIEEHRHVMEQKLGRPLAKGESVHHRNGRRADNRPDNLELWIGGQPAGQRAADIVCPHCGRPYYVEPDSTAPSSD